MAIYIPIRKESETESHAVFSYGLERLKPQRRTPHQVKLRFNVVYEWGSFRIDKETGVAEVIQLASGDNEQRYFAKAAAKIAQHWKDGGLPSETCYAA